MEVIFCFLPIAFCSLFATFCLLFITYCSLLAIKFGKYSFITIYHLISHCKYAPCSIETKSKLEWLKKFDSLVHNISPKWNGLLLITGYFNIDFLATECTITKYYNDILNSHHLFQVIAKSTRRNISLIDHFITNTPEKY